MRKLRVGSYALWDMGGISPERPLTFALRGGPRDIVVTENGYVLGMLWRADLLAALRGGNADSLVGDLMDSAIHVADVDDSRQEPRGGGEFPQSRCVAVAGANKCPVGDQPLGQRAADAARRAGDDIGSLGIRLRHWFRANAEDSPRP